MRGRRPAYTGETTRAAAVLLAMLCALSACVTAPATHPSVVPPGWPRPMLSPATTLRDGTPASVGLDPAPIAAAQRQIAVWTQLSPHAQHPMYAGEVSLLVHDGVVVSRQAAGYELRYADRG